MDVSQFESLNVTSPPVPASLPLNCCILSKNAGFFSVTVNDSQHDCAMQLLKAAGLPNSDRPFASFSQRVQPPLSTLVSFLGALVIEPRLEASVMEPFCMKTRSPSFTAITSLLPCRRQWMEVTMNLPSSVLYSRSVTVQSVIERTPWALSQVCKGRTRESYW